MIAVRSSSAYSLRAFHHLTNIGSRVDLIDDLEVGENLPRRKLFDFLLVQAVEPMKERPLVRRQFRMLFGARHGESEHGARSTFIFAASLARSRPRSRRLSSRRALRAARQVLESLSASLSRTIAPLDALIVSQSTNHPIGCPKNAGHCPKDALAHTVATRHAICALMSRRPSTTLADFSRARDSQITFSVTHGWSAFWRGRPWLAGRQIGETSSDVGSSRFWTGWVTKHGDKCARSTCRD